MRKLGILVALTTASAVVGIAPTVAGAQTQPTPEVTAFCDAGLKVDRAFAAADESDKGPTKKQQQAIDTALTDVQSKAPPEIAADVQSVIGIIQSAAQNKQNPEENPTFQQNLSAIDQYRYNSCGYNQVQVTGIEYEFQGLPKTLPAGKTAIQFTDNGAELHELDVFRVKGKDSVKKIIGLSEKEQRKKVEGVGGTFATQGQTTYTFVDLTKPGRYGVVCHLPVGSTTPQAAEQAGKKHAKSHAQEGMYATITVEAAATTTTAAG
jgi:hypothetical protein